MQMCFSMAKVINFHHNVTFAKTKILQQDQVHHLQQNSARLDMTLKHSGSVFTNSRLAFGKYFMEHRQYFQYLLQKYHSVQFYIHLCVGYVHFLSLYTKIQNWIKLRKLGNDVLQTVVKTNVLGQFFNQFQVKRC